MVDDKCCFVICPIGDIDSPIRKRSDLTFNYIIRPVVESFDYKLLRADQINEPGMITNQIIDQIVESSLVIADLTDYNPNVFYELAIRHIVKKPYIQMIKSDLEVPFDIYDMRTIPYDIDLEHATNAKKELEAQIRTIEKGNFKPHNPITSAKNYSTIQKMIGESTQIELGDISQVFLNSISELSLMISEMKSEIYELKKPLKYSKSRNFHEIIKMINNLEEQRNNYQKTYLELKNEKAPASKLKEYKYMISTLDKNINDLENQLLR